MRIVVSGGGTGGHITPILATLQALRQRAPELEVLFIGSGHRLEHDLLESAGFRYVRIPTGKWRRYRRGFVAAALDLKTNAQNLRDMIRLQVGVVKAYRLLGKFKPDVVFCKGGYVSVPVGIAAHRRRLPLLIHESDSVMGLSNRYLARLADKVAVSFTPDHYSSKLTPKLIYTGTPVRPEILSGRAQRASTTYQLTEEKPNVLIQCGSLGAQRINAVIFEALEALTKRYNVVHITGQYDIEWARVLAERLPLEQAKHYRPVEFVKDGLGDLYAWATLVISRAGANNLAELAATGLPSIIIPLATSATGDQLRNAQVLARAGAVRLMTEDQLTSRSFINAIDDLAGDKQARSYLSATIKKFYEPEASERLADTIIHLAKRG